MLPSKYLTESHHNLIRCKLNVRWPDERRLILIDKTYFEQWQNAAGHYPRPVTPSTTDGALFKIGPTIPQLRLSTVFGCLKLSPGLSGHLSIVELVLLALRVWGPAEALESSVLVENPATRIAQHFRRCFLFWDRFIRIEEVVPVAQLLKHCLPVVKNWHNYLCSCATVVALW